MSAQLRKNLRLSSALNITEVAVVTKKQGIVSILGPDTERPSKAASLRRTLSADMSSKKWLTQHGFSPLKKIASSEEFRVSIIDSSSEGEEDYEERKETEARGQFDIWTSIQEEKNKKELEKPGQFDIWSSIISQKADQEESSKSLPPPYIHPLVKRSASSLSEKSLEICTESLGSETGSDEFSSYPPSENGDMEEDKEEYQELQQQKQERALAQLTSSDEEPRIVKFNYDVGKKWPHQSFPPPIPSLSRKDGASVRMKTHRDNGRLVLEAVSMPSQNNFLAQRQDGRLVLTFVNTTSSKAESEVNEVMNVEEVKGVEELEEEFESFEEEERGSEIDIDEEEQSENEIGEVEDRCYEIEQAPKLSSGEMNVHRLAAMMNKPIWLANRNPTWPKFFDEIVKFGEEKGEKVEPTTPPPLAQSLPPWPLVARLVPSPPSTAAAAASFNSYEYYWRRPNQPMSKSAAAALNPLAQQSPRLKDNSNKQLILPKNLIANDQQQLLVLRGNKGDYFVPLLKGCKEPRRSLLFWQPYCIATS